METILKKIDLPEAGFSRLATVLQIFPVSRSSWYQGIREGRYPRQRRAGHIALWKNSDLIALFQSLEVSDV